MTATMSSSTTNVGQASGVSGVAPIVAANASPSVDATSSLLPEPACFGGSTVTQLAMLMTQVDQQDQRNASLSQDDADKAIEQADAQHVQDLRDKAGHDLAQAVSTGLGEIADGGLSLAGAVVKTSSDGATHGPSAALAAGGKMAQGGGTIVAGVFRADGDRDDAKAAEDKAAADSAQRRYDRAKSASDSASDSIQKVEQFLQGILQTQAATTLKAAGGPA
jgi:hypothetical protein